MRQQCTERKAFALRQLQPCTRFDGLGDILFAIHNSLLDHQKAVRNSLIWRNDHFTFGVIGKLHAFQHPLQMLLLHLVEWGICRKEN